MDFRPRRRTWERAIFLLAALALVVAGFASGIVVTQARGPVFASGTGEGAPDLSLAREALRIVTRDYVFHTQVKPEDLDRGAVRGLVDALGDEGHTRYMTPEEWKIEQGDLQGRFEGIGAEVNVRDGRPTIVAPLEGSPAERAGLQPGDVILKIEGQDTGQMPIAEVIRRIRGPSGTTVTITVLRPATNQTRDVQIARERLTLHPVTWTIVPGTSFAHVHISQVSAGVSDQLRGALEAVRDRGAAGVVLDLRNNPGGLLDEAVSVASQFLKKGNVLLEEDANGNRTAFAVRAGGLATDLPIVVLINNGTASAGEVIAGALADHQRGPLIGETTVGAGTVLRQFTLGDGSVILLGVAQWLTPNGTQIWHRGVEPDVRVPLPSGVQSLLPREESSLDEAGLAARGDLQLNRAIEDLNARTAAPAAATPTGP